MALPTMVPMPPRMAHSLPRRKASVDEFGRNGPGRRSAGPGGAGGVAGGRMSPEPLMEYFVPRSVSEFNLAGVVAEEDESTLPDLPDTPKIPTPLGPPGTTHQLTAILRPPGGAGVPRKLGMASSRSREKMVTFEDDASPAGPCPQRKVTVDDVFM